jgi:serine protease inhibitor
VDVNEEGTEAAAATGVVVGLRSAAPPPKPKYFKADHPFLFLIRDHKTGTMLFLGRVENPRA